MLSPVEALNCTESPDDPFFIRNTAQHVIARYEAIPDCTESLDDPFFIRNGSVYYESSVDVLLSFRKKEVPRDLA